VRALGRPSTTVPLILSLILVPLTVVLAFVWTGEDVDQGFSQKIFYLHVPVALTSYAAFGYGAFCAAMYLWRRDPEWDLRSYVGVHSGTIFGTLVLLTGPIWAKASWGVWWNWGDRQINVFLILFLYYCAYFMLRFSLDEGERRRSASAVYALLGVGLIPLSFLAVRIAETLIHPTVFTSSGAAMPSSFFLTFLVGLAGMLSLMALLMAVELRGKRTAMRVLELQRAARGEDA
jgi:heme exporter protein C